MDIQTLRDWDELFSTAGWKRLCEEITSEIKGLEHVTLHDAKTFDEVSFYRGQAFQLSNIINLEDTILNMAKAEREAEEEDADLPV